MAPDDPIDVIGIAEDVVAVASHEQIDVERSRMHPLAGEIFFNLLKSIQRRLGHLLVQQPPRKNPRPQPHRKALLAHLAPELDASVATVLNLLAPNAGSTAIDPDVARRQIYEALGITTLDDLPAAIGLEA